MFTSEHRNHSHKRYSCVMPSANHAVAELTLAHERFCRSTANLTESLPSFAPAPGMMTTAQQVAHTARVIDWFMEGAFRNEGFALDFDEQIKLVLAVDSLEAARAWMERSVSSATSILGSKSDEDLSAALPEGPIMGGMPRIAILSAITDHTAHHRGALTVYARLNGIEPPDPYTP